MRVRIVLITPKLDRSSVYPVDNGYSEHVVEKAKALIKLGHQVFLLSFGRKPHFKSFIFTNEKNIDPIELFVKCPRLFKDKSVINKALNFITLFFFGKFIDQIFMENFTNIEAVLRKLRPDYVILEANSSILIKKILLISKKSNIKIGIQFHNWYSSYYGSMLITQGVPRRLIEFLPIMRQIRQTENLVAKYIDRVNLFCVSETDKNQLSKYLKDQDKSDLIKIIENGLPTSYIENIFNKKHINTQERWKSHYKKYHALFIGSKNSVHNYQTVLEIWKIARDMRNQKNVKFIVVGSNWEKYKELNFEILGSFEDLSEVLIQADFAFLPMKSGGGTKLKTLRFISSKIPLICTKYAVQGLGFKEENHFLPISVKQPKKDFINILNRPNLNQDLKRVAQNAFLATRHLSWETIASKLVDIIAHA